MTSKLSGKLQGLMDSNEIALIGFLNKYAHILETGGSQSKYSLEEAVESIVNYYEAITACMPSNVYWLNQDGVAIGCNENVLRMLGLNSLAEFKGLTFEDMGRIGKWSAQATESFKLDTLEVVNSGQARLNVEELPIPNIDGELIYFLTSRVPLIDRYNKVIGIVGISVDITERKRMEEMLKIAKEKAESADHAKTEFLENMRHDIRTPVSGIAGLVELLQKETNLSVIRHYASNLDKAVKEVLRFLDAILESVHIASGNIPLLQKRFNIREIVEQVITLHQPTVLEKALDFSSQIDDRIPEYLIGDPVRLYRILSELIGNALKFTSQGFVHVAVQFEKKIDDKVILKFFVEDSGIGIPPEKQAELFVRFKRLTPSYEGIYKGSGLGLSVLKQFLDDLSGEIYVDSQPGRGSCFLCVLSLRESLLEEGPFDFNDGSTVKPWGAKPNLAPPVQ